MSQAIDKALRVKQWLDDDIVKEVIADVRRQNYDLFLHAPNDEGRRMAQAQAIALDAVLGMFRAILDAGEREQLEQNATVR